MLPCQDSAEGGREGEGRRKGRDGREREGGKGGRTGRRQGTLGFRPSLARTGNDGCVGPAGAWVSPRILPSQDLAIAGFCHRQFMGVAVDFAIPGHDLATVKGVPFSILPMEASTVNVGSVDPATVKRFH